MLAYQKNSNYVPFMRSRCAKIITRFVFVYFVSFSVVVCTFLRKEYNAWQIFFLSHALWLRILTSPKLPSVVCGSLLTSNKPYLCNDFVTMDSDYTLFVFVSTILYTDSLERLVWILICLMEWIHEKKLYNHPEIQGV